MLSREIIKNSRISDLVYGVFIAGDKEIMKSSYLITKFGEKISRTKIIGSVLEKYIREDKKFGNVIIDDGTECIIVRVFENDLDKIEKVNIGELVFVVGKIKNYNNENYIIPDFIRRLNNPNYEIMFKLEFLNKIIEKKKISDELRKLKDQMSEEELINYAFEKYNIEKEVINVIIQSKEDEIDYKPVILEIMSKIDVGNGVEINKLLEASKLDKNIAEETINNLINLGEVYEPVVGRLKRI